MRKYLILLCGVLLSACGEAAEPPAYKLGDRLATGTEKPGAVFRETSWDDLSPKGWNPMAGFKREEFAGLRDGDPRANEMLRKLQEAWNNAPAVQAFDRQNIRIAGFLVPLDAERDQVREFLLVPYFGACIHTPPPPSNQTIHVVMDKAFKGRMMEPFWISGELRVLRSDSPFGASAYTLKGVRAEAYVPPARP